MRHLKVLVLLVFAAGALGAWIGPSTAAASRLCDEAVTPCPSPNMSGATYTASLKAGTEAAFAAGFSTIKCKESSLDVEQTNAGGGSGVAISGTLKGLSFGNCNGGNAIVKATALGSLNTAWTAGFSGSITGTGTKIEIISGTTKCFYGGSISSGLVLGGGSPAIVTATNVELARETGSSALCANPAKLSLTYSLTGGNSTVYVTNS